MLTVDVHCHLMPAAAFERLPSGLNARRLSDGAEVALEVEARGTTGRGAVFELRDLGAHRAVQAERDVDVSLLGPWIDMIKAPVDAKTQHAWCDVVNDELARVTRGVGHSRFVAAVSDLDGARAADNLERAVSLGAVGGMLCANPEHGTLARHDFEALWVAAARLDVPIIVHPGEFQAPERLREHFMVNLVGNPFETTLAVGTLLAADVPGRHPDLRLVLVHGGGFFPYQFGRLTAGFERWGALREVRRQPPRDYLRWFLYDTVLFDDEPTRYLLDLVGPERVLAGSDCPFTMSDDRPFASPERLGLDEGSTRLVLGANAASAFGLDGVLVGGSS